ncbi:U4/U6.U5 small nuclear ribonucleoprotein 27 kDa protein [Pempheris klunzingeri]|uniref:U4/U6.U5 small nuclear ribonucleoprotein 27 kDa protein n=1 Tax=Pempheris klunzingeri TaxID=3127111 RepID=UPI00397F94F1
MGRSRSRTPPRRERRRSRSASRERERRRRERERSRSRERDRERRRSRSRSPHRRRSRSPRRHRSSSLSPARQKDAKDKVAKPIQISAEDMQGKTEEEIEMMKQMGFGSFDTTKGKKTDGSVNAFAVNVTMKRKYRQYMNRKGGFNRPLDFIA